MGQIFFQNPNPSKTLFKILVIVITGKKHFKRYAQVPPSPNDSGMHGHAHIGHGPQCAGRVGRARSRGCRGSEVGQNGHGGRGEASSLSASHSRADWLCKRPSVPAQHRLHGASQARLCHAHMREDAHIQYLITKLHKKFIVFH